MVTLGDKLRQARVGQGLQFAQLSERTKIGTKFLAAIEADDRGTIPGGFFYRNWALQYGRALGLDEAEIAIELDSLLQPAPLFGEKQTTIKGFQPSAGRIDRGSGSNSRPLFSVKSGLPLILIVLACSGFYAWWRQSAHTTAAPAAPGRVAGAAAAAVPPAVQDAPSGDLIIEVAALKDTWLSISPDGKRQFSGVLKAKELKTFSAHENARIQAGNAAGIEIRLNGKPIGPIGPSGQVRTLMVTRNGFQIVPSTPVGRGV